MKKLIIFALIGLLMIPTLANAEFWGISWYKNYKVEKNITPSIVAGSTDTIEVSFKNPTPSIGNLVAVLNVNEDSGNYPVWLGDFKVRAELNSTSLYEPNISSSYSTDCVEGENGTFYCFNLTEMNCIPIGKKFMICFPFPNPQGSFIVLPGSENELTFYVTFNPALIPSNYSFNVTLYNDILIKLIEDPASNSTKAGEPTLFDASLSDTLLWITTNKDRNLSVDVTLYQYFLEKAFIPENLTPVKFVGIEANDTTNITSVNLSVYYKDEDIPSWVDENSLRLYYYDTSSANLDDWDWRLLDSGVNTAENYVWARTNHLSLFGIFGSPSIKKEAVYISGPTIYLPGGTSYRNVTQNVTIEKPVYIEKEVPAKPVCGNGICEVNETQTNCCIDCGCSQGYECRDNVCVAPTTTTVPQEGVTTVSPFTGFAALITSPTGITLISLIIVILIAIYIFYQKRR